MLVGPLVYLILFPYLLKDMVPEVFPHSPIIIISSLCAGLFLLAYEYAITSPNQKKQSSTFSWPMSSFWSLLYWTCEQNLTQLITSSFLIDFLYFPSKILCSWFSSHFTGHFFVFCVRFFFSPEAPNVRIPQGSVLGNLYLLSLCWWFICSQLPNMYF